MKKSGVFNPRLAAMIAACQHGDIMMICDSGFPIPFGKETLDLSVTVNLPRLLDVVNVILQDLNIEGIIVTHEMEERSRWFYDDLLKLVPGVPVKKIPYAEFKEIVKREQNIFFVRTGEATPFANTMLVSGVIF